MKHLDKKTLDDIIEKYNNVDDKKQRDIDFKEKVKSEISVFFIKKTVLGFDIYRYSQYPTLEQSLIPHLFKVLYEITIMNCIKHEPVFFHPLTGKDFSEKFIDTGDGGFQIFDNPVQAVIFALYFQANILRYNSGAIPETLNLLIGEVTLRYSLTYDLVYHYENNYYGPAIINNSRILGKDKLNRFLVDNNTIEWFVKEINGIENLQLISYKDDFSNIPALDNKSISSLKTPKSLLFDSNRAKILALDLLKIGEIKSKLDTLFIHSVHIQALMTSTKKKRMFTKYTVTLGNLNSSGISE